jgi:hypothetical protein
MTIGVPHRNRIAYPSLWSAVDGAIRDACNCHPDIDIPEIRRASLVKRIVGNVLALEARAAAAAESRVGGDLSSARDGEVIPSLEAGPAQRQGRSSNTGAS